MGEDPPQGTSSSIRVRRAGDATELEEAISRLEERFEQIEPDVQAFLPEPGRFERLRREVAALAERYPQPGARPPLYGALVGVKDIFRVDGFPTRAGSQGPPEALAGPEAEVVTRMRAAGALVVGKTVTTEFAYFAPGPTHNPHHLGHTPGGSSSGSAAGVAAGLCDVALGTQTIGSVIRPAAFCGVVGFKPSYGRVPAGGVIPLSPSLDHVGLFAGSADDVTLAASVACNSWSVQARTGAPTLGVPEGPYLSHAEPEAMTHYRAVLDGLAASGALLVPLAVFDDFEAVRARHDLILAAEAAQVHAAWFDAFADFYHPRTRELIERGRQVSGEALLKARQGMSRLREELSALMASYGLDAWVAPSAPGPAPKGLDSTGDPVMNLPWTQAGMPAFGLPSGWSAGGLPFGLQVVGRWDWDEELAAVAAWIESRLDGLARSMDVGRAKDSGHVAG